VRPKIQLFDFIFENGRVAHFNANLCSSTRSTHFLENETILLCDLNTDFTIDISNYCSF